MQTECSADLFGFAPVDGRRVVAAFDGGTMTSEAGAMLLGATDGQIRLIERFAGCFTDYRAADLVEHTVSGLVGQRVFGLALGFSHVQASPLTRSSYHAWEQARAAGSRPEPREGSAAKSGGHPEPFAAAQDRLREGPLGVIVGESPEVSP